MWISDLRIKKIVPKKRRFEISDGNGLYLRINPSGTKTWVFRYQFNGIPRRLSLGKYPGLSLADARTKHGEAMRELQRGNDPGLKAKEEKARMKQAPSFMDLLEEFWSLELSLQPSGKNRKRLVEKDVLHVWGKRRVASITRRDAVLLLDGVRQRAPVGANRLQGVLVRMFNFASERGIIERSPLMGMRRGKEKARSRVLTDEEVKALWSALDLERKEIDIYRPTKLALKMILLTGQRPGEVAGMKWEDLDGQWWTIPATATKTREENRVPVLPMAEKVIEEARVYSGGTGFVFASSYNVGEPLTVRALSNAIRRHRAEMGISDRFTPHDLRRTLRTRLAEAGVSDIVAERLLGHKLQGVLGIYNRHTYEKERSEALGKWERRLKKIIGLETGKAKIISIREAKRSHV